MKKFRFATTCVAMACGVVLTACGGGGDGQVTDIPAPPPPAQPVGTLQAPAQVAQSMGAVALPADTYDVAAMMVMPTLTPLESLGTEDYWRITLDRASRTYAIRPVRSESKMPNVQGGYTTVKNGDVETITFENGRGQLKISDAYKTLTGIAHGAQLIGTGYAPTAIAPLDGNYNFVNVGWTDSSKVRYQSYGQASIKNGALLLCPGSTVQADGSCTDGKKSTKWDMTYSNGLVQVKDVANPSYPVNTAHLIASDVGKALVIAGGMGSTYLVQASNTGANVINGNWSCNEESLTARTMNISAPSLTYNGRSTTVLLNALYDVVQNKPYTFPGFVGADSKDNLPVALLPLSSKLAVGTIGMPTYTGSLFDWCTR